MRSVIVHYHIYKNSGTSFDNILTENFKERHILFDGPFPYFSINQLELDKIIVRNRNAVAFSSHQIALPVPCSLEYEVIPVVFIRHPLLRIFSIYNFKRKYPDGTNTSKLAVNLSFAEWIKVCLEDRMEIVHISNAQTRMLGTESIYNRPKMVREKKGIKYDINQALRNIGSVQLLGRTEFFDNDIMRFTNVLSEKGIDFKFEGAKADNVTSSTFGLPLEERVSRIRNELSEELYEVLCNINEQDFRLFNFACNKNQQ